MGFTESTTVAAQQRQAAEGKNTFETQMILNHKQAIEFLVESFANWVSTRIQYFNLHALLSDNLLANPAACGRIRQTPVGIGRSVNTPLATPQLLEEYFQRSLEIATGSGRCRSAPELIRHDALHRDLGGQPSPPRPTGNALSPSSIPNWTVCTRATSPVSEFVPPSSVHGGRGSPGMAEDEIPGLEDLDALVATLNGLPAGETQNAHT